MEEETPISPKRRKRNAARPKSEPSSQRLWAQSQIGSPRAKTTLSGVPMSSIGPVPSTSTEAQPSTSLAGVQSVTDLVQDADQSLTGIQANDTLPDLVLNRTEVNTTSGKQELDAANVLLSLGDSLESTIDDVEDNAGLMPIGGGANAPIDVAPQPLRLDQVSVDAAIAGIVQSEDLPPAPSTELTEDPLMEPESVATAEATQDADPEDEIPLAALSKSLEKPKSPVKGVLKTKTYRLKKKPDSNRTFKCPACETWKSSVHRLSDHYKRRHPPQMCGICGRTFDLPSSLS